jgi:hypothetical protein
MNRLDLQKIAKLRVREAKVLLDNGHFEGSYYLLGYSIECAFKACIAKKIKKHDFPDKKIVKDSYTHDLEQLLNISGLKVQFKNETDVNPSLAVNWAIVKDWSEETRYSDRIMEANARALYKAVTARNYGILSWLKRLW